MVYSLLVITVLNWTIKDSIQDLNIFFRRVSGFVQQHAQQRQAIISPNRSFMCRRNYSIKQSSKAGTACLLATALCKEKMNGKYKKTIQALELLCA
jgi:hypothetical protein